jgi:hypothetical protein
MDLVKVCAGGKGGGIIYISADTLNKGVQVLFQKGGSGKMEAEVVITSQEQVVVVQEDLLG